MSKICLKCGGLTGNRQKKPTMCLKCYNENRPTGDKHPRWNGTGICPKCGGKKSTGLNHAKFCRKCCEHKGEKHYNFGKHLSDEVKMKISLGNTGKRMGSENHKFNPNKVTRRTYRFPYQLWRKKVLELDNYTCRNCDNTPTNIVHHIDPYRDNPNNLDLNNGISLCKKCHEQTFGIEYKFIDIFKEAIKKRVNSGEVQNG